MVQRTPRNYNGVNSPGKKIGDLLPEIISDIGRRGENQSEAVFILWFALIGKKMAPLTEPVSLIEGVLTIKVKSATLYSLLSLAEKARLLKQLQEKFPIRNLVFRIG
jgi:hypothetical protein